MESAEWEHALDAYSRRLDAKPTDSQTLCNRSFVLLRLERCEEALVDAERCVQVAPASAKGHLRRAQALDRLNRRREALHAVNRALKLDPTDEVARKLRLRVDVHMHAGLEVVERLRRDADDRRQAVRALLPNNRFVDKWKRVAVDERRRLVLRMLAKGFQAIKTVYMDAFQDDATTLCQQELLAANVVLMTDALDALGDDGDRPTMLNYIVAVADDRENDADVCGRGMTALMDNYRFPFFREHPQGDHHSVDLVKAQRSTLCLVLAHLLLGGDGLPSVTTPRPGDNGTGSDHYFPDDSDDPRDYGDDDVAETKTDIERRPEAKH